MGSGDVCVGARGRRPYVSELCCLGTAQLPQRELQFVAALPSHRIPPLPPPPPPHVALRLMLGGVTAAVARSAASHAARRAQAAARAAASDAAAPPPPQSPPTPPPRLAVQYCESCGYGAWVDALEAALGGCAAVVRLPTRKPGAFELSLGGGSGGAGQGVLLWSKLETGARL